MDSEDEAAVFAEMERREKLYALEREREDKLLLARYEQGIVLRKQKAKKNPGIIWEDYDEDVEQLLEEGDFAEWNSKNQEKEKNGGEAADNKSMASDASGIFLRRQSSAEIFMGGILNQGLSEKDALQKGDELFFLTRRHEVLKVMVVSVGYDGLDAVYGIELLNARGETRQPKIVTASRHLFRELYKTEEEVNQVPMLVDGVLTNMGFFFNEEFFREMKRGFSLEYTRLKKAPLNASILVSKDGNPIVRNKECKIEKDDIVFLEVDGYAVYQMNPERRLKVTIDCILRVLRFKFNAEDCDDQMEDSHIFNRRDEKTAVSVEYRYVLRDARTGILYNVSSADNKISVFFS